MSTAPVVYPQQSPSAFVRLLKSVASLTDQEPVSSFTHEDVMAAGEELIQVFRTRVREACGHQAQYDCAGDVSGQSAGPGDDGQEGRPS